MKKKILFVVTMVGFLFSIIFWNSSAPSAHASRTDEIQQSVKTENKKNNLQWTTIVNVKNKSYKILKVKNSFSGNQIAMGDSIKVEYGHVEKSGRFKSEKVDNNFKNYKIVGNNVIFNFKNVKSAIKISYTSKGQQTGRITNTTFVNPGGNNAKQKTIVANVKGTGSLSTTNNKSAKSPEFDTISGTSADDAIITDSTGKVISHDAQLNKWVSYTVSYDWSIPNGMNIKEGDTVKFELPDNVQVRQNIKFNVTEGANGPVIGTFEIKKGQQVGTLTFNNYLQDHPQIDRQGTISIEVNGKEDNKPTLDWNMNKAGWVNSDNQPTWNIVVNPESKHYDSLTVTDKLGDNQVLIPGSMIIQYGHWDKKKGQFILDKQVSDPSDLYKVNGNKITFNFKDVNSAIQIVYNVKTDQSGILHNSATATADGLDTTINAEISYSGKGTISGEPIVSSSSMSSSSRPTVSSSSMNSCSCPTTSSSSMSSSSRPTVSSSSMSNSSSSTTVPDTPYDFTNFTVNKKWDSNNHPTSVVVKLLANGKDTGKTATLSNANSWTYTWKDLPAKDSNGKTIKYSAQEVNIPNGYTPNYSDVTTGTTTTTVWLPADHWENGHKYIMTTSPNIGTVNALQDCGKRWQWNGHTVNVSSNENYPRYITDEEAHKENGSFIWTTELYKTGVKIDHLNGRHDVFTLVGYNGEIASLQGAQDMVEYGHRGQTNCQWFYGSYQGGQNQPAVPQDDWSHVMGGANFYYPLSNGGTGDGNHKSIPLWYAYEQQTVTANSQEQTITNKLN